MSVKLTLLRGLSIVLMLAVTSAVVAADRRSDDDDRETVELFAAMEAGDIHVRLIPKDATEANVLIENKSGKPLKIMLPEAFAGMPVHPQFAGGGGIPGGGGGFGGGGFGGGGQGGFGGGGLGGGGGGGQGFGGGFGGGGQGGFGGGGGGFGGGGLGGGFFNVDPDKVRKIEVPTVCLEHGKPDPNPRMEYTLRPINDLTDKEEVVQVCKLLATGKLDQTSAQAAAWHFTDNLSWPQLAQKVGKVHLNGTTEPYFTQQQLVFGLRIAQEAARRAEIVRRNESKSDSLSQSDQ